MAYPQLELVEAIPMRSQAGAANAPRRATASEFAVLAFVVASFAYEIPLVYLTNFYKANPYLFDIASLVIVSYWLLFGRTRGWRPSIRSNPMLAPWTLITGTFFFGTLVSATWLPGNHLIKSVWYCAKYIQGYVVLLLFFSAPLDEQTKRRLLWVALAGGTLVAVVALLQFFGIVSSVRVIPKGMEIAREGTGIFSTLGHAYFHTGFFGVVSTLIALAVFQSSRGTGRMIAGSLAALCAIPAVISGSRAAFLGLLISMIVLASQPPFRRYLTTYLAAGVVAIPVFWFYGQSYTKERTESRSMQASATHRFFHGFETMGETLEEHGALLLLAGGGFMVVPIKGQYRAGFGNHNMFLFPLEQGGVVAFAGALWLWVRLFTRLRPRRHNLPTTRLDENLKTSAFAFLVAALIVGWSGTAFWMRNGMAHFVFYELLFFGLALSVTGARGEVSRPPDPVLGFETNPDDPPLHTLAMH